MITIVVPLGGTGKSFKDKDYTFPKPLIEIHGNPMIQWVIQNLWLNQQHRFIFVVRQEDIAAYNLAAVLELLAPGCEIVVMSQPTLGAACSVLLTIDHINNDDPLLIANGDQYILGSIQAGVDHFVKHRWDGGVFTFESVHPRWSFVKLEEGCVVEATEKRPISRHATCGLYYFRKGSDFVQAAMSMIRKQGTIGDQYFVCPAYNELVLARKKIGVFPVANDHFFPLGTPEDIKEFETYVKSTKKRATGRG